MNGGLLHIPTVREVINIMDDDRELQNLECYTLPEAAVALGKSQLTLKRWIKEKLIPPPIWEDAATGYMQYTCTELEVIGEVLKEHEALYDYLHCTHLSTIDKLWQRLEGHRKSQ